MRDAAPPTTAQFWPISGDGATVALPWRAEFDALAGEVRVNLGATPKPETERAILQRAGSYGRQIGWISEALEVVIDALRADHNGPLSRDRLDEAEIAKLERLAQLLEKVERAKRG